MTDQAAQRIRGIEYCIENAKVGDAECKEILVGILRRAVKEAPLEDLITLAEFHADMLRRHT